MNIVQFAQKVTFRKMRISKTFFSIVSAEKQMTHKD